MEPKVTEEARRTGAFFGMDTEAASAGEKRAATKESCMAPHPFCGTCAIPPKARRIGIGEDEDPGRDARPALRMEGDVRQYRSRAGSVLLIVGEPSQGQFLLQGPGEKQPMHVAKVTEFEDLCAKAPSCTTKGTFRAKLSVPGLGLHNVDVVCGDVGTTTVKGVVEVHSEPYYLQDWTIASVANIKAIPYPEKFLFEDCTDGNLYYIELGDAGVCKAYVCHDGAELRTLSEAGNTYTLDEHGRCVVQAGVCVFRLDPGGSTLEFSPKLTLDMRRELKKLDLDNYEIKLAIRKKHE